MPGLGESERAVDKSCRLARFFITSAAIDYDERRKSPTQIDPTHLKRVVRWAETHRTGFLSFWQSVLVGKIYRDFTLCKDAIAGSASRKWFARQ